MSKSVTRLRAIDLYSGVGGWSLGLHLAGIDVVASYERWGKANETNFKNNHHQAQTVDIRNLQMDELPSDIDIVVGSPPCTQFSYSNRGGNGDIGDGMKDIIKFLTIVDHLKPSFWAMENVPRVAKIIEQEVQPGGCLEKFKHLGITPHVIRMEEYGLPQRRRRCIAGNFNFKLLSSYTENLPRKTLGDIVESLAHNPVIDPIYGLSIARHDLRDHVIEDGLNEEEIRINRASKVFHPVYNSMSFPDKLDKAVRTITATCTRVSRESIVIEESHSKVFRRLTVRERACLQGFPVTFQFYGDSFSQKLRMVGNAIPPVFTYYIAHAFKGTPVTLITSISETNIKFATPVPPSKDSSPDRPGSKYPLNRRFRFAIPSLRLKSGVRFELVNSFENDRTEWRVSFYFGNSKSIQSIILSKDLHKHLLRFLNEEIEANLETEISKITNFVRTADIANMQRLWSHKGVGETRAFMLLDKLDESGDAITKIFSDDLSAAKSIIDQAIEFEFGKQTDLIPGINKLKSNAPLISAGLFIGSCINVELLSRLKVTLRNSAGLDRSN